MNASVIRFVLKPLVFLAALGPVAYLVWAAYTGNLSANPLSDITNETGIWVLRFLCITLTVTPLRRLTGWNALIRFRRMFGLFAFFYATLHFLIYVVLDRLPTLDLSNGVLSWATGSSLVASLSQDIAKRPFITIGFTAFVLLIPLAATSTAGMIRRLGGRNWNRLHRLIYASAIAGVIHYWWGVKSAMTRPQIYAVIVGVLLVFRISYARVRAVPRTNPAPTAR